MTGKVFTPAGIEPDAGAVAQFERCMADERAVAGALMADHHLGYSMPIGGVIAYQDAVSPSGVGFDIGCGNMAVRTGQAMNDGGRHWIKGALKRTLEDESLAYCAVGSIEAKCDDGTVRALALWLLGSVTAGGIENFNDHESTTWADVEAVFGVAIRNAERFAEVNAEAKAA